LLQVLVFCLVSTYGDWAGFVLFLSGNFRKLLVLVLFQWFNLEESPIYLLLVLIKPIRLMNDPIWQILLWFYIKIIILLLFRILLTQIFINYLPDFPLFGFFENLFLRFRSFLNLYSELNHVLVFGHPKHGFACEFIWNSLCESLKFLSWPFIIDQTAEISGLGNNVLGVFYFVFWVGDQAINVFAKFFLRYWMNKHFPLDTALSQRI